MRRAALRGKIGSGVILLPGNEESPANYPNNPYRFRQDSTFLYFFGLNRPGFSALMDADSGKEMLFGDDLTMDDIIWTGPQPTVADSGARAGVTHTFPSAQLAERLAEALRKGRRIHFLPPYRAEKRLRIASWLGLQPEAVAGRISVELATAVVSLREAKSAGEIAEIEKACATAYRMHTTAMQMCRPGATEREIAGAIEGIALQEGAGVSFPPIVTQHGETLHNHDYSETLRAGRMLLVDAGAETTHNYCSDFTRTFPVDGKFTRQQRDIYEIVLAANRRAVELSRPEAIYRDVHKAALRVIAQGVQALGLMRGDPDEAVAAGAVSLFMPHGIGHQMGLDVHDMEDIGEKYVGYDLETQRSTELGLSSLRMGRRLKPGFVVTVEPGIYFIPACIAKWKNEGTCTPFINFDALNAWLDFGGIRIEENILITPSGNRMLGRERIPVTVEAVERMVMQREK